MKYKEELVALFTRAWIEIPLRVASTTGHLVALFTRAWIEIARITPTTINYNKSPSLRGRGLKYPNNFPVSNSKNVALFTRAWIEIDCLLRCHVLAERRPLYEGVD